MNFWTQFKLKMFVSYYLVTYYRHLGVVPLNFEPNKLILSLIRQKCYFLCKVRNNTVLNIHVSLLWLIKERVWKSIVYEVWRGANHKLHIHVW